MRIALLLLLAALLAGAQDEERIRELVKQFQSESLPVREDAAAELVLIGSAVLPHLRKLEESGDPDLRARARALREAIAKQESLRKSWPRGKRVTLDARNRPLAEVLKQVSEPAGNPLAFDPEEIEGKVSVRIEGKTFWEALFEVCRAAKTVTPAMENGEMRIVPREHGPRPIVFDGEFTVWLDSLMFTRNYTFQQNPHDSFDLSLVCAWERPVKPVSVRLELEAADDDTDTSLLPAQHNFYPNMSGTPGEKSFREFRFGGRLAVPGETAAKITRLAGSATFVFPLKYETAEVPLKGTAEERREIGGTSIRVWEAQVGGRSVSCNLEVSAPREAGMEGIQLIAQGALRILDDRGEAHPIRLNSSSTHWSGNEIRTRYTLSGEVPDGRSPSSLEIRVLREQYEKKVEFDFRDIPLP